MAASTEPLLRHLYRLVSPPHSEQAGDAALLKRYVSHRDELAFAALVARHGPMVLGVCRRILRDNHDAEDVFQATFLVLARKASRLRHPETLAAWLYGTARHLALTAQRGTVRRRQLERTAGFHRPVQPSAAANPLDELTAREMFLAVDEELARLPEIYRLPLILCGLEGRTHQEAARLLGWTQGSVKGRLERGRARLHDRLRRRGLALSATLLPLALIPSRVSASLVEETVRASQAFALGIREGIAAPTWTLAESALASAITAKMKIGLFVLALGLAVGTGAFSYSKNPSRESERAGQQEIAHARGSDWRGIDRYGDPLPDGALARLGTIRFRQGFYTRQVAFSPDGKSIACAGAGRGVCLWDAATGRELRRIGRTTFARSIAFSPNGKMLACASELVPLNKDISSGLYATATGRKIADLPANVGFGRVAFAPDGKSVAAMVGPGNAVHFFDAATGKKQKMELSSERAAINRVAWAPGGKRIVGVDMNGFIHLWDAATGKEIAQWKGNETSLFDVAFSPDGQRLAAAGADETIGIWDAATHKKIHTLGGKHGWVRAVLFSPDGRLLASGHGDGTIALWDGAKGEEIRRWRAHAFTAGSLDFSPDGKTLVSGAYWECGPRLWDVATGAEVRPFAGHTAAVDRLMFSPDGSHLFSLGAEKRFLDWDLSSGGERLHFQMPIQPPTQSLDHCALSPRGDVAASWSYQDGKLRLWNVATGKEQCVLGKVDDPNKNSPFKTKMRFSPDGRWLAFATNDHRVSIWDTATGKLKWQLSGLPSTISGIAFSLDGRRVAAGSRPAGGKATIALWEMETGESVTSFSSFDWVFSLDFSPDGKLLATGSLQGPPRLWDAMTGRELHRLDNGSEVYGIAFSPDGKWLAGAGADQDQKVHIWEVNTGLEVRTFRGHIAAVGSVAFAPDGCTVASGGVDSTVLLWDFTGRRKNGRWQTVTWTQAEVEQHWRDLASNRGSQAVQAIWDLAASPRQAVPLVRQRIQPVKPADAGHVEQLIDDLGSKVFETRKKASDELEKIVERAEPVLRKKLREKPPLEVRQRIRNLLNSSLPGKRLRALRAVQVLEYAGTSEARKHLRTLAGGMAEAQLTREAQAALNRLTNK